MSKRRLVSCPHTKPQTLVATATSKFATGQGVGGAAVSRAMSGARSSIFSASSVTGGGFGGVGLARRKRSVVSSAADRWASCPIVCLGVEDGNRALAEQAVSVAQGQRKERIGFRGDIERYMCQSHQCAAVRQYSGICEQEVVAGRSCATIHSSVLGA
jgi:hypothetical protein